MDRILYFPYISIPNTPWLARTVLYWDTVGSIVPTEFICRPEQLDPHMRKLVAAQLVQQVFPGQYRYAIPRFREAFLEYLDRNQHIFARLRLNQGNTYRRTVQVHIEKLDDLAYDLIARGLAEEHLHGPWYRVEKTAAYYFMTYLASVLSAVSDYQPATDTASGLANLLLPTRQQGVTSDQRQMWRAKVLDNLLPGPTDIEDVNKLLSFKEAYGTQLLRFRHHIEQFLLDLEAAPPQQADERIERFLQIAKDQVAEITARMREHRWQIVGFSTLCAVSASLLPLISTATTGDVLGATGSALGIISAIAAALSRQQLQEIEGRPLAYAVLADRKLNLRVHGSTGPTFFEVNNNQLLLQLLQEQPPRR